MAGVFLSFVSDNGKGDIVKKNSFSYAANHTDGKPEKVSELLFTAEGAVDKYKICNY